MRVDLHFCGREAELAELERRWLLAANLADPKPQLVVLTAERGIGKTRLVAEFYRRLAKRMRSSDEEMRGYWPDGEVLLGRQIALNPPLAQCDLAQPAPFLWWGITAQEGGADALAIHDRHLIPHLVSLSFKAKLLATGRTVAKLWLDVGVDFVVGLTGFDTIVSVGKGAFETARIVSQAGDSTSTLAMEHAAQQVAKSRADAILNDLEQVLNPNARLTFAKVPAVIVLDDSQFAKDEPALTRLFERLLFHAHRDRWPLMIVVTHWAREYALDWNEGGRSVAGVIRHAVAGSPTEPGPAAGLAGGYLSEENFTSLEMATVPDLSAAVAGRLPGLSADQVTMLVEKTDGNGRFLEQVLAFAESNPRLFVNFDLGEAFTDAGAAEVEAKSTNILEVVSQRLNDELVAPEVRQSLALASFQGIRAIREIVNEVGEAMLGLPLGDAMLMGDDPHSLMVFDDRQSVGKFAERLFLQAASDLRRNLRGLHEDHVLSEALCRALMRQLLEQFANPDANAIALEAMSIIAFDHFASAQDVAPRELVLTSLAIRLALSTRQANPDAVRLLTAEFFSRFRSDPDLANGIPHDALLSCADAALWLDEMDDAAAIVSWRVRLNHERSGGNVDASSAPAIADWLERNVTVEGLRGNDREASISLNSAMSLRQSTMHVRGTLDTVYAYAQTGRTLARLQEMHGQGEAAIATARALVALYNNLQVSPEDEVQRLRGLGWSQDLLTSTAAAACKSELAQAAHWESLAITRDLVSKFHQDDDRRNLSASLNKANIKLLGYPPERCLEMFEESVAIMRELTGETAGLERRRDLAVSLTLRARCHSALGQDERALGDMEDATTILQEIASRLPTLGSADDVIASIGNLRSALVALGQVERARQMAIEMVTVADRQGEADPRDKAPWTARLVQARTERELGDEAGYGQRLLEAQMAAMERLEKGPVSPEIAVQMGTICHLLGEFQAARDEWAFAQLCFATGRNILLAHAGPNAPTNLWEPLLATSFSAVSTLDPEISTNHHDEIQASFAVGVRQAKAGRLQDARRLAQAAFDAAMTLGVEDSATQLKSLLNYIEQASEA